MGSGSGSLYSQRMPSRNDANFDQLLAGIGVQPHAMTSLAVVLGFDSDEPARLEFGDLPVRILNPAAAKLVPELRSDQVPCVRTELLDHGAEELRKKLGLRRTSPNAEIRLKLRAELARYNIVVGPA